MKAERAIVTMDAVTINRDGDIACMRVPLTFMFNAYIVYDNVTGKYMAQVFDDLNYAMKFKNELAELKKNEEHEYMIRKM